MKNSSTMWLVGGGAVILVLIVASVVVALLNRPQNIPLLPEGTPAGTVHRYLLAIEANEARTAYNHLSADLQEECTFEHFRDSTRHFESRDTNRDTRVTLEREQPIDDAMEVRVRITEFYVSGPFDVNEHSYTQDYLLEEIDGTWQFVDEPWPLTYCPEPEKNQ